MSKARQGRLMLGLIDKHGLECAICKKGCAVQELHVRLMLSTAHGGSVDMANGMLVCEKCNKHWPRGAYMGASVDEVARNVLRHRVRNGRRHGDELTSRQWKRWQELRGLGSGMTQQGVVSVEYEHSADGFVLDIDGCE